MFQELQIFFDNSQIVGREKISEISQGIYCLNHNTENQKHDDMLRNLIDSRVFVQDGHDFMRVEFSTYHRTDDH